MITFADSYVDVDYPTETWDRLRKRHNNQSSEIMPDNFLSRCSAVLFRRVSRSSWDVFTFVYVLRKKLRLLISPLFLEIIIECRKAFTVILYANPFKSLRDRKLELLERSCDKHIINYYYEMIFFNSVADRFKHNSYVIIFTRYLVVVV